MDTKKQTHKHCTAFSILPAVVLMTSPSGDTYLKKEDALKQ